MSAHAIVPAARLATPETYLDPQRARGFLTPPQAGTHTYPGARVALNEFALKGTWHVGTESIEPFGASATITGGIQAAATYLVMTSDGGTPRTGRVLLDGRPIPAADAGADVRPGGYVTVTGQRLYTLVKLPSAQQHVVSVELPPGVSAYDFTFG